MNSLGEARRFIYEIEDPKSRANFLLCFLQASKSRRTYREARLALCQAVKEIPDWETRAEILGKWASYASNLSVTAAFRQAVKEISDPEKRARLLLDFKLAEAQDLSVARQAIQEIPNPEKRVRLLYELIRCRAE